MRLYFLFHINNVLLFWCFADKVLNEYSHQIRYLYGLWIESSASLNKHLLSVGSKNHISHLRRRWQSPVRWTQWKVRSVRCSSSPSSLAPFSWHPFSSAIFVCSDNCAVWATRKRRKIEVDVTAANVRLRTRERIAFCWANWRTLVVCQRRRIEFRR